MAPPWQSVWWTLRDDASLPGSSMDSTNLTNIIRNWEMTFKIGVSILKDHRPLRLSSANPMSRNLHAKGLEFICVVFS